jgi:hypothetical protein
MKSIEILFNEALAALDKAGKRGKYEEKIAKLTLKPNQLEVKLNCAEETLRESRIIRKYNGSVHNRGVVQEEFRESAFSEGYIQETTDPFAKTDRLIMESVGYTPEQIRIAEGGKPAGYADLSEGKKKEFDFAVGIGLSEADAFKVVAITGGYGSGFSKGFRGRN